MTASLADGTLPVGAGGHAAGGAPRGMGTRGAKGTPMGNARRRRRRFDGPQPVWPPVPLPPCPSCGSTDVVPVLYGLPGGEAWKAEAEGRVVLGGCLPAGRSGDPVRDWGQHFSCRSCGAGPSELESPADEP